MSSAADNVKKLVGFIDMQPTWAEILPTILTVYRDGNPEGQRLAREELERMAALADRYVENFKKERADGQPQSQ